MKAVLYLILLVFAGSLLPRQANATQGVPSDLQASDTASDYGSMLSEPNGMLTLEEAQALALMHNPMLSAYSWEVRAAEARALQAGLRPNPELEVEVEEVGGGGARSGFDGAETTVQISQRLERSGKAAKRRNAAALDQTLAGWDYKAVRLDVLAQTTGAFIDVLAAQDNLQVTKKLLELSEEQVSAVTQRVQAGKDAPLEQNKAEVLLSQVRIEHTNAAHRLQNARRQLAACWNRQEPAFTAAEGRLEDITPIPTFGELAGQLTRNPDIARWADEVDRARAQEKLERANGKQDWTVSAGMQRFNESDDNAVVFGVSIPLPIFDRNQGNIAAARYTTRKIEQQQKAASARIHAELSEAYQALAASADEAQETKQNILKNAEWTFEAAQESYKQGKSDYLSVLDAQRTLIDAETQYIRSLTEFHKAWTDVERLTGTSDIHDNKITVYGKEQGHE